MKFFKWEDFLGRGIDGASILKAVDAANAKLEREGKIIEIEHGYIMGPIGKIGETTKVSSKSKALLINIETIEACTHPEEKVKPDVNTIFVEHLFKCECGAKLKPKTFEVVG